MSPQTQNGKTKLPKMGTNKYQMIGMTVSTTRADGWSAINYDLICKVVLYTTCAGDAVLFSTSNSGGLSLTIYSDGEPTKIVSNSAEDMTKKLSEVVTIARNSIPPEVLEKMEPGEQ
jgi:hypothetical protein